MEENDLPPTVRSPEAFLKSLPANFDGTFDWSWTKGCFGETNISPTDFDGVVERHGNFLIFETKDVGVTVPQGQLRALKALWQRGGITLLFVYGKMKLERCTYILAKKPNRKYMLKGNLIGVEEARNFVKKWYKYADTHRYRD